MEVIDRIAISVGTRRQVLGGLFGGLLTFAAGNASAKKQNKPKRKKKNHDKPDSSSDVEAQIVNGSLVSSAGPVVSLHITGGWRLDSQTFFCTGTLISPRHVLTANHCYDERYPTSIIAGRSNLDDVGTGDIRAIARATQIHGRDMQVLEFTTPITSVKPAILPGAEHSYLRNAGQSLTFAGWGSNTADIAGKKGPAAAYSPYLFSTALNIVKEKACLNAWTSSPKKKKGKKKKHKKPDWIKTAICTRSKGTDTCWGDSGSGGLAKLPNGDDVVMAVVSGGLGCADFRYPGINEDVLSGVGEIHTVMGG